ncbi:MAG: DUF4164 domain-containing protein [Hyphomicrobiales bacterium]
MPARATIDQAIQRLNRSIDALEAAVNRRLEADAKTETLEDEVQRLGADRSKLAQSLDEAEARSVRLEDANKEVSRRLVAAMESIRIVLEANGG